MKTRLALRSGFLGLLITILSLAIATPEPSSGGALPAGVTPCVQKQFRTKTIAAACARGGQPAAIQSDTQFMRAHRISSCVVCHAKLAPDYELTSTGLDLYFKDGGT